MYKRQGFANIDAIREAERCLECGCQANTDCKLRDFATEYKVEETDINLEGCQKFAVDSSAEFIVFDANRCISCGQCVDTCSNKTVHGALSFMKNEDGTSANRPECRPGFENGYSMGDSNCVQCGA
ncbi:4Fe-4S binding protein, partial [Vibrio harveyi]|uniref:4Fe-4S binding protein n=1 Tax=Vibrio harveyi TaxID=669 RepID=UPI0028BED942